MVDYRLKTMAELAHQLKLSPVRLRLKQIDAVEYLVDLIEPEKSYPYEFVCHQLTGYRPKAGATQRMLPGKALIADLVQLAEDLSAATTLPVGALRTACWTTEELAERLNVSSKTICRWRRRGLPGRKLRYPDGSVRMAFLDRCVRRFVARHIDLVRRGAAFSQLTPEEKQRVITRARELLADGPMRLHELSQKIAAETGRAVETIRYTLRRHDEAHPDQPLFRRNAQPDTDPRFAGWLEAVRKGRTVEDLAVEHGVTPETVRDGIRRARAALLKAGAITFVYSPEFDAPGAEQAILGRPLDLAGRRCGSVRPPRDLPPYLQDLYREALLDAEQERAAFRRFNYLKFLADRLRSRLQPAAATDESLDRIERLLAEAETVKNEILRANLRLVVSIARRHVGRSPHFFEVVSDGNMALIRAVEKFDYTRGYKFSTYASWAVMRHYARTVPERMVQAARMVTGVDEMLAAAPAAATEAADSAVEAARHLVAKGLQLLTQREQEIVVRHYGLDNNGHGMTLDQIGESLGVTKERVRQIERRALARIRAALSREHAEFVRS